MYAPSATRATGSNSLIGSVTPNNVCSRKRTDDNQRGSPGERITVKVHGVDRALKRAWEAGVVLSGISAGSNCWFEASTTDSFGPLAALNDGLGLVRGSHSPHYDGEPARRPTFQRLIGAGDLPDGLAADDGVALVFDGTELAEAVASRPDAPCVSGGPGTGRRGHRNGAADALPGLNRLPRLRGRVPRADDAGGLGTFDLELETSRAVNRSAPARRHESRRQVGERRQHEQPVGGRRMGHDQELRRRRRIRVGLEGSSRWGRSTDRRARPNTSRSRSSSRGPHRCRLRRPNDRSSSLSCARSAMAPEAGSWPAGTSSATTALWKSAWSVTPTGLVA